MSILSGTVLIFIFSSLCDGQFLQRNVHIHGFSCTPLTTFSYQCNSCQCNIFGTSADCVPAECPVTVETPGYNPTTVRNIETTSKPVESSTRFVMTRKPITKPKKRSEDRKPGAKHKHEDGCNECVRTASWLWACTNDCNQFRSASNSTKRRKRSYSYECYKEIMQETWVCEARTGKFTTYLLNTNHMEFFRKNWVPIEACNMETSCTVLMEEKIIEFPCPDGEETLDLDDTEAEEIPVTTTTSSVTDSPTTVRDIDTAVKPVETTPRFVATTPRTVETTTTPTTTPKSSEDIDAPVEKVTTTEAVTKDANGNNSIEEPAVEIQESGDSFMPEQIDNDDFRCKPNLSFKLECNTCWCRSDGKGPRYCTRIACKPKTYRPLTQQQNLL